VKSILHPGDRVIAKRTIQGIVKGHPYHVEDSRIEVTDFGAEVPTVVVSTWPERNPVRLTVRCGIVHLKLATQWTLL
jgi:hypothetical protein